MLPYESVSESDDTIAMDPTAPRGIDLYGEELAAGALAGDYEIQATIARGGWGTVYEAQHRIIGRRAAVKVLHRDLARSPKLLERFVGEAKTVNRIGHDNIVDIYDIGQLPDGRPYLVMELLGAGTLEALCRERGRLAFADCLAIVEPLARALSAAHQAGVVHRDLKPSNVHVEPGKKGYRVKLLDFGIAKLIQPEVDSAGVTTTGYRLGTPETMAPEQIRGERVDPRTDVYALGVLLFRMLTGELPFRGPTAAELHAQQLSAEPTAPSDLAPVPAAVDRVVLRCLEKRPEDRYPSAMAVVQALRKAGAGTRARDRSKGRITRAVAVYVEARLGDSNDDLAVLDDLDEIVEIAEEQLGAADFSLLVQTGGAVLAARVIAGEDEETARQTALDTAVALYNALLERGEPNSRVAEIVTCVHLADAVVRPAESADQIAGGPITQLASWGLTGLAPGLYATRSALAGLRDDRVVAVG